MSTRSVAVVTAGLRQPSSSRLLADRLSAATAAALTQRGYESSPVIVELRDHAHELVDNLVTGFAPPDLRQVVDAVSSADGLIAVSPIFTASYSALFKAFFDVLDDDALTDKPVLMGATGGTERHSLALEHAFRPMFSYLRAVVAPTAVYAASTDWGRSERGASRLTSRIDRGAAQFADLVAARQTTPARDPLLDITPFEQLLHGSD
jgi:FMN reductase